MAFGDSTTAARKTIQKVYAVRLAEALIRAGKFFDLIMLPARGHGLTYGELVPGSNPAEMSKERLYSEEATRRYFVEHLEPGS